MAFSQLQSNTGTYSNTGTQTTVPLGPAFDTANGAPAANPIVINAGPGLRPYAGVVRFNFSAVAGTNPAITPYYKISDDSSTWRNSVHVEESYPVTGNAEVNANCSTRARYIQAYVDLTGTSYSFAYTVGLVPGWAG